MAKCYEGTHASEIGGFPQLSLEMLFMDSPSFVVVRNFLWGSFRKFAVCVITPLLAESSSMFLVSTIERSIKYQVSTIEQSSARKVQSLLFLQHFNLLNVFLFDVLQHHRQS